MVCRLIFSGLAACALALAAPQTADARAVIVGDSYTVAFDQAVAGHNNVTATIDLLITSFTSSAIGFSMTVKNTDSEATVRLTAFGWQTTPGAASSGHSETSSTYDLVAGSSISPGLPAHSAVNTCFFAGSNCAGGGSGGLGPLAQESFTVSLAGSWGLTPAADFSLFAAKFQTGFGSFEPNGTIRVAEPSALAVFLIGLAALSMLLGGRRSRSRGGRPTLRFRRGV